MDSKGNYKLFANKAKIYGNFIWGSTGDVYFGVIEKVMDNSFFNNNDEKIKKWYWKKRSYSLLLE